MHFSTETATLLGAAIGGVLAISGVLLTQMLGQRERRISFERERSRDHAAWLREKRYHVIEQLCDQMNHAANLFVKDPALALLALRDMNTTMNRAGMICRVSFLQGLRATHDSFQQQVRYKVKNDNRFDMKEKSEALAAFILLCNIEIRGAEFTEDPFIEQHQLSRGQRHGTRLRRRSKRGAGKPAGAAAPGRNEP